MKIQVETSVHASVETVWQAWTTPEDIMRWNAASDDWHTTAAQIDLREGGRFCHRMEAKDGSMGFDFEGTFTRIIEHRLIEYTMTDGRGVSVQFESGGGAVTVRESFDAESEHDAEQQRQGWQAILDRFAQYVEGGE